MKIIPVPKYKAPASPDGPEKVVKEVIAAVRKNGEKAVQWFTRAAEQGMAGSQTTLAMMYETGNGVEKDAEEARKWYTMAGFSEDEMNLGEQLGAAD